MNTHRHTHSRITPSESLPAAQTPRIDSVYLIPRYIIHTDFSHTHWSSSERTNPPDRLEVTVLAWKPTEPVSHTEAASPSKAHRRQTALSAAHQQHPSLHPHHPPPPHPTWQTPASRHPLVPCCAPPTPLSASPSPSRGRGAGCGRRGKSNLCLRICPAHCQPNARGPTQRQYALTQVQFLRGCVRSFPGHKVTASSDRLTAARTSSFTSQTLKGSTSQSRAMRSRTKFAGSHPRT